MIMFRMWVTQETIPVKKKWSPQQDLFQSLNLENNGASISRQNNDEAPEFHDAETYLIIVEPELNETNLDTNLSTNMIIQTPYVEKNHPSENII